MAENLLLRPIRAGDDADVARLIRDVMTELGASGPGFAIHDTEVDAMSEAYERDRAGYYVVESSEHGLLGAGGFAPLEGASDATCELRKMYFRPALRGRGVGRRLLLHCLRAAAALGFERCYLETLESMQSARRLYERSGFVKLRGPRGRTGHFGCDAHYERPLEGIDFERAPISTERLVLRVPRTCELASLMQWLGDPEAMRYIGDGKPRTPSMVAHFVALMQDLHETSGLGSFIVTLGAEEAQRRGLPEGHAIGDGGLVPVLHSGRGGFRSEPVELGYRFATPYHGFGYATEVARALVEHARALRLEELVAVTHPQNAPSMNVLRKLGFTAQGRTTRYYDTETEGFRLAL
jgi:putative acetyltransferase